MLTSSSASFIPGPGSTVKDEISVPGYIPDWRGGMLRKGDTPSKYGSNPSVTEVHVKGGAHLAPRRGDTYFGGSVIASFTVQLLPRWPTRPL